MPKSLEDFRKLQETEAKQGGKKVEWNEIARKVIEYGKRTSNSLSVKEIWEGKDFVNKRVTQFRTMNALNKLFDDGVIDRKYDGKRYWYGPKEKGGKLRGPN